MKTLLTIYITLFAFVACAEDVSYIQEYKPPIEDEILFSRIQAIEQNNHMTIYDFVYRLNEGDELILTIDVHRNGEADKSKSMIMRVTWHRSRFSQKGMGIFRIIEKQYTDGNHKFSWYFDFDSGGGFGLSSEHPAYKTSRLVIKEDAELDKDRLIFHRYSEQNEIDIKVKAKIVKAVDMQINPVLEKLYK